MPQRTTHHYGWRRRHTSLSTAHDLIIMEGFNMSVTVVRHNDRKIPASSSLPSLCIEHTISASFVTDVLSAMQKDCPWLLYDILREFETPRTVIPVEVLKEFTEWIERRDDDDRGRYMVSLDGGNAPAKVHQSKASAIVEAYRLSVKHPSTKVRLLHIEGTIRSAAP